MLVLVPCLELGGTEAVTLQLCCALLEGGLGVLVCVYHEYHTAMVDQYVERGIGLRLLGLRRLPHRPLCSFWQVFRRLRRVISEEMPDVIHVQYLTPTLAPLIATRLSGVPVLATIHVSASHYGWLGRNLVRLTARFLCSAFVCVSQHVQQSFFGFSCLFQPGNLHQGGRVFSIPNCVDPLTVSAADSPPELRSLREQYGISGKPIIGFVGRMETIKGLDVLLRAFTRIAGTVPEARLVAVGDGSRLNNYRQLAVGLGIEEKVVWTGRMPRNEVIRHLQMMDIVAMPSRPGLEGFGLSAAEAMACARPVVASAVDALPEVVAHGETGILVPPEDDLALANALLQLLRNPQLRVQMGTAGRNRVVERFSFGVFKQRILGLYSEVALPYSHTHQQAPPR